MYTVSICIDNTLKLLYLCEFVGGVSPDLISRSISGSTKESVFPVPVPSV